MMDPESETDEDLEQRVAFEAIRGRLFGGSGQPVTIGRFVVTRRLGQGGMGVVYAAYDPQLDRKVAVKLLHDVEDEAAARAVARRSLEREARAAAGLSHPNVVTVYDSGTFGDGVYVAMELVEGATLRAWLETRRGWPEIVRMFLASGLGLQAAHEAGLVHCDFKPDNVLVGEDGRPRVVDFGLVKSMRQALPVRRSHAVSVPHAMAGSGFGTATVVGGTLAYMPPEQLDGRAEARSDQYAFCVALYLALFEVHPYGDGERIGHGHERTRVPRAVVRAIVKGLAQEVGSRHASMHALLDVLQRALKRRARRPWVMAGAVVLLGASGATYGLARVDPCQGAAAELDAVWTAQRKDAVTTSLAAAGDPGQAEVLAQRLDEYAQGWSSMSRESCEATHVRGVQSAELLELRTACLGRRRTTFVSAVERLQELSVGQGEGARVLVETLRPVAECTADALRSKVGMRGMDQSQTDRSRSPEAEGAAAEVVSLLVRTNTEALLGTREEALALAVEAEALARERGLRYLEAEAIERRVSLELDAGEVSEAEAELHRALALAVEVDDAAGAAQVVSRLLSLERLGATPVKSRALLVVLGRAWAARTPRAADLRARINFEEASHAQAKGDHETALALIDEALAALATAGLDDDTIALKLRTIEGSSLVAVGRLEEAKQALEELLAVQRARLPAGHEALGDTMFYLANTWLGLANTEAAVALAQDALAIYRERHGPGDSRTLQAQHVLARAWLQHGERPRAAAELEASIETVVRMHGGLHANELYAVIDLADLEYEAGELARARIHAMLAMTIASRSYGRDHVLTAICGIVVAKVAIDQGELERAQTLLAEARARVDGSADPLAPAVVSYQLSRLALRVTPPDPSGARRLADEALAQLRVIPGEDAARLIREIEAERSRPSDPDAPLVDPSQ